jgi:hypothetical protein
VFCFTLSSDPFPRLSKEKVRRLRIPVLIITGENTIRIHRLVNEELARLLPKAERATIPRAGHFSPRENPQAFNEAVLKFFQTIKPAKESVGKSRRDAMFIESTGPLISRAHLWAKDD